MDTTFKILTVCNLSDLGRKGLTYDWSKLELSKKYFISSEDVLNMDMLWQLAKDSITKQAQSLDAEILMWEEPIKNGWYLSLILRKKDKGGATDNGKNILGNSYVKVPTLEAMSDTPLSFS